MFSPTYRGFLLLLSLAITLGSMWTAAGAKGQLAKAKPLRHTTPEEGRPVKHIQVEGNELITDESIRATLRTKVGERYSDGKIRKDIRALLQTGMFANLYATPELDGDQVVVTLHVTEKPVARSVEFVGNRRFGAEHLRKEADLGPGSPLDLYAINRARDSIVQRYKEEGYRSVTVTIDGEAMKKECRVIYRITEGPRVHVRRIVFNGNTVFSSDRLEKEVETRAHVSQGPAGLFVEDQVEIDARSVARFYSREGFLDASVSHRVEDDTTSDNVDIVFVINEGPRHILRKVEVLGNVFFDDQTILKALTLQPGNPYSQLKVVKDVRCIKREYRRRGYVNVKVSDRQERRNGPPGFDVVYTVDEGHRLFVEEPAPIPALTSTARRAQETTPPKWSKPAWWFQKSQEAAAHIGDPQVKLAAMRRMVTVQVRAADARGARELASYIEWNNERETTFAGIVAALAKAGDIAGAIETAHLIDDRSLTARAACEIADAQTRVGRLTEAKHMLGKAEEAAMRIAEHSGRSEVLLRIVRSLARVKDRYWAMRTAKSIQSDIHRVIALTVVGELEVEAGDTQSAREVAALIPDMLSAKAELLFEIVRAEALAGRIRDAREVATTIGEASWEASAFCHIAEAEAKAGNPGRSQQAFADARRVIADSKDTTSEARLLTEIAEVQARIGDAEGSKHTIVKAVRSADEVDGVAFGIMFKVRALLAIAEVQTTIGDAAGSKHTIVKAVRSADKADGVAFGVALKVRALLAIAKVQTKIGDAEGSKQTIAEAVGSVAGVDDAKSKVSTLLEIAEVEAKTSDSKTLGSVLAQAGRIVDSSSEDALDKDQRLMQIAVLQADAGRVADALKTRTSMKDLGSRAKVLARAARTQSKEGDLGLKDSWVLRSYTDVVERLSPAARFLYCLEVVEGLLERIEPTKGPRARTKRVWPTFQGLAPKLIGPQAPRSRDASPPASFPSRESRPLGNVGLDLNDP